MSPAMTAVAYALSAMWVVGLLGLTAYMVVELCDELLARVATALVALPVWAVLGFAPFLLVQESSGPELATLLKSEWRCTAAHTSTIHILVGKVMVPSTSTVCDAYGRLP